MYRKRRFTNIVSRLFFCAHIRRRGHRHFCLFFVGSGNQRLSYYVTNVVVALPPLPQKNVHFLSKARFFRGPQPAKHAGNPNNEKPRINNKEQNKQKTMTKDKQDELQRHAPQTSRIQEQVPQWSNTWMDCLSKTS